MASLRHNLTDLHRSFWSWIGSYTVEEGNFVSNMTVDWGSRSADEISLLRQAWCAVDPEPPHIGATSWVDLKSRRDAVWSQMVDWCVGNSVTVDQNSIVIARQVMHHLIQEAVQAKRQREISDRPGTTLDHFVDHVNEAYDTTTAPWTTFGPRSPSEQCSECIYNQELSFSQSCLLSDHLLPDDSGVPLSTTHGCASFTDRLSVKGFNHRESTGRLDHAFFRAQGFDSKGLEQVYRVLSWLLTNVDCEGDPFLRYTESKDAPGATPLPPGLTPENLRTDMEANHRAVSILDVERWERFIEERFGRRSAYNLPPVFSRQRSDWDPQGNLEVDIHLIVGEFVGRLVAGEGEGRGLNQYNIRDNLYDHMDAHGQVPINVFYGIFDSQHAGHMTETFLDRTRGDQNAARYQVVNPGTPAEAVQLDQRHVRHHQRRLLLHHHAGGGI